MGRETDDNISTHICKTRRLVAMLFRDLLLQTGRLLEGSCHLEQTTDAEFLMMELV